MYVDHDVRGREDGGRKSRAGEKGAIDGERHGQKCCKGGECE